MQKLSIIMRSSPQLQRLKIGYELLAPKDRRAIQVLTAVVLVLITYVLILEPFDHWVQSSKQDYVHQQGIYDWFQNNKNRALALQKNQKTGVGQRELSSVLSSTARQVGLTLSRVQPDKKGMSVWVEDTAYQKLLKWLVLLETKHEVLVQQIRIDQLKEEGRIKGYIHLVN